MIVLARLEAVVVRCSGYWFQILAAPHGPAVAPGGWGSTVPGLSFSWRLDRVCSSWRLVGDRDGAVFLCDGVGGQTRALAAVASGGDVRLGVAVVVPCVNVVAEAFC